MSGAAIEARLYAEDPEHDFLPSPGQILALSLGADGRGRCASIRASRPATRDALLRLDDRQAHRAGADARPRRSPGSTARSPARRDRAEDQSRLPARADAARPRSRRRVRHRLHRRASRTPRRNSASARTSAPCSPAARACLARDVVAAVAEPNFDPWAIADSFELLGARHVGLDVLIDGKPDTPDCRQQGREGIDVRMASRPARPEESRRPCSRQASRVYAFAGGRQAYVQLIDPLERPAGASRMRGGGSRRR